MHQVNLNSPLVRAVKKCAIGVTISTPIVAILQGAFLLYDYRSKHGNAPHPDVPSRGIVVAAARVSDRSSSLTKKLWSLRRQQQQQQQHLPPLRLLVIGDSLAAGVGIRESSTPILPASIAKELSSAMEGRPVYWTCVGTPGISSSLLVQDIYQLKEEEDRPIIMLQRWAEWQTKRAQARIEAAKREAQDWLEHRHDEAESDNETDNKERSRSGDKNNKNSSNPIGRWIRRRVLQIQKDVNGLIRVVRSLDLRRRKSIDDEDSVLNDDPRRRSSHRLKRHPSVDPAVVGPYDIAVVLTGLNDLKDVFLPFMMTAQRKRKLQEAQANEGVKSALLRIVHALEDKMPFRVPEIAARTTKNSEEDDDDDDNLRAEPDPELKTLAEVLTKKQTSQPQDEVPKHAPLVVFPALPINPIEMSQVIPLRWFLIPIIRAMDHNKKLLAEMFPGLVVFVDSPSNEVLSDVEAKRGPLWENSQDERILLQLTDVAQKVRERVETLMKQHYQSWFNDQEEDDIEEENEDSFINATLYELEVDGICLTTLPRIKRRRRHDYPGSTMVSCDGVHPSDFGYDFWGRYIAAAIIKELNLQSVSDCEEENNHAVHT